MSLIPTFIDFESFWSQTHTLTRMSPMEYCLHPETEIISCAIKVGSAPTSIIFGETEIRQRLTDLDWSDKWAIAHNMSEFDSMLLSWRLGIRPRMWGCTLAMARPIHAKTTGLSLAKLVEHYRLGVKDNTALINTKGRHLADFTAEERAAMARYNTADTDQCADLFYKLLPHYTAEELFHIDCNIRMLVEPQFVVDRGLLETALSVERSNKRKALLDLAGALRRDAEDTADESFWDQPDDAITDYVRAQVMSAAKFSQILESRGVEVPMKPSPSNPKVEVPALAKTDEAFVEMQEHDDPIVSTAARARLSSKSTILETRIEAFLAASAAVGGRLPVPLKYCGADTTGRDSGWGYNPQNLPRIDPNKPKVSDALRNCLRAPKGYVVGVADQSGIELRVNHFLWEVPTTLAAYAQDPRADLYKDFAAHYYNKPPAEVEKGERQFAKVCLAEGTIVLTSNGPKPIETVSTSDLVWDGVEWVHHDGPVFNGVREVISYDGLTATPDHVVWAEDGRRVSFGFAASESLRLMRTGAGGVPLGYRGADVSGDSKAVRVSLRSGAVHRMPGGEVGQLRQSAGRQNPGVPVVPPEMRRAVVASAATGSSAPAVHQPERPRVAELWRSGCDVRLSVCGCGGGLGGEEHRFGAGQGAGPSRQQLRVSAGQPTVVHEDAKHGEPKRVQHETIPFVPSELPDGSVCGCDAAPLNVGGVDGRADPGEVQAPIVQAKRRVWDILNAGPRHRFTANDVLVSNCQLGLGFGSGAATFRRIARLMGGIDLSLEQAESAVSGWRARYADIVQGWKTCGESLGYVYRGVERAVDPKGLIHTSDVGMHLPSGRVIRYPDLRYEEDEWPDGRPRKSWVYGQGRHKTYLTPAKVDENLVQGLARDSVFECAMRFFKSSKLRPILRVHDELIYMFPVSEAEALLAELQSIMRTPPSWWPELVVWSEGGISATYGAAK